MSRYIDRRYLYTDKLTPTTATSGEGGFTLLELLVALTLAAIISLCISTVGNEAQKIYEATTTKVEVYQKFRYALDDIQRQLEQVSSTASLEFFQDQSGKTRGYWDEGEELKDQNVGPNLEGGVPGKYDEGMTIFERKYLLAPPGLPESEHWNDSIYFKAPVEVAGQIQIANIEYFLADPMELAEGNNGKIAADTELYDNRNLILMKVIRYLDINGDNFRDTSVKVLKKEVELCQNVTDLRIQYMYDNIFDSKPGGFLSPSEEYEGELVKSEWRLSQSEGTWTKVFLYGGFKSRLRGTARRGERNVANAQFRPVEFDATNNGIQFSQLSKGDQIFIWTDGTSPFPTRDGGYTVDRHTPNGRLIFNEEIPFTFWDSNPGSLRFRAGFVPPAFKISVRVLNEKGKEPRTLSTVVRPLS